MSKNVHKDVKNTMWKSKLSYSFNRNMQNGRGRDSADMNSLLLMLNDTIENYPKESKMVICEYTYKRREMSEGYKNTITMVIDRDRRDHKQRHLFRR
ncbi:MAG: hypothetical protein ACTTH5_04970 [Wolinella sp.]